MVKMFISGSMSTDEIGKDIMDSIDFSIRKNYHIVVGDARGVDKNIQQILKSNNYKNVIVYHVGETPRNKIDSEWTSKRIEVDHMNEKLFRNGRYTREAQMQKDLQMALDSDFGLVIWEDIKKNRFGNLQVSKGSLNNIFNLLCLNKKVGVYLQGHSEKGIIKLNKVADFEKNILSDLVHTKTQQYYLKIKKDFIKNQKNDELTEKNLEQTTLF